MASDLGASKEQVRKWDERNRIPSTWWFVISESKVGRKNRVSFEVLGRFERERAWEKEAAA